MSNLSQTYGLNPDELAVLRKLSDAWALFLALPRCHPMEVQEGVTFIHGLQGLVTHRAAVRAHPAEFTHTDEFAQAEWGDEAAPG